MIVALAVAFAGWVVNLSRDWRIVSYLIAIGAFAGAALQTTALIEALEQRAEHRGALAGQRRRERLPREAAAAHELVDEDAQWR